MFSIIGIDYGPLILTEPALIPEPEFLRKTRCLKDIPVLGADNPLYLFDHGTELPAECRIVPGY